MSNQTRLETQIHELTLLIEEALDNGHKGEAEELYNEQNDLCMELDQLEMAA